MRTHYIFGFRLPDKELNKFLDEQGITHDRAQQIDELNIANSISTELRIKLYIKDPDLSVHVTPVDIDDWTKVILLTFLQERCDQFILFTVDGHIQHYKNF
jgi:hypothetical protein